jgi:hypothetical protein|uniref:Uncharacterized protein n=1 Tax=Zea mays TaxID=4577 RepID=A0A804MK85_MAIZE
MLEIAAFRYALERRPPPSAADLLQFSIAQHERRHHVVQRHALPVEHLLQLLLADHQLHPDDGSGASCSSVGVDDDIVGRLTQAARRGWHLEDLAAAAAHAHDLDLLPVLNHQAVSHDDGRQASWSKR